MRYRGENVVAPDSSTGKDARTPLINGSPQQVPKLPDFVATVGLASEILALQREVWYPKLSTKRRCRLNRRRKRPDIDGIWVKRSHWFWTARCLLTERNLRKRGTLAEQPLRMVEGILAVVLLKCANRILNQERTVIAQPGTTRSV